ncbi:MAG: hypothetical protein IPP71_05795 [Bacteroidetes bacterium]|nr:hypothetical protein [Bacteroidota bacterium]
MIPFSKVGSSINLVFFSMKKVLIYFWILAFSLIATNTLELIKLPFLFQHYYEYKDSLNAITFREFMYEHYIAESARNVNNPDSGKDEQLPYNSGESFQFSPVIPFSLGNTQTNSPVQEVTSYFVEWDENFISYFIAGIWQPPKVN